MRNFKSFVMGALPRPPVCAVAVRVLLRFLVEHRQQLTTSHASFMFQPTKKMSGDAAAPAGGDQGPRHQQDPLVAQRCVRNVLTCEHPYHHPVGMPGPIRVTYAPPHAWIRSLFAAPTAQSQTYRNRLVLGDGEPLGGLHARVLRRGRQRHARQAVRARAHTFQCVCWVLGVVCMRVCAYICVCTFT